MIFIFLIDSEVVSESLVFSLCCLYGCFDLCCDCLILDFSTGCLFHSWALKLLNFLIGSSNNKDMTENLEEKKSYYKSVSSMPTTFFILKWTEDSRWSENEVHIGKIFTVGLQMVYKLHTGLAYASDLETTFTVNIAKVGWLFFPSCSLRFKQNVREKRKLRSLLTS